MSIHKVWYIVVILLLLSILYYYCNPEQYQLFPKCPFVSLTGYKCIGCGSQRVIHSLLHLDIAQAFKYNMLLVISIPYLGLLIYTEYYKKNLNLYSLIHNYKVTIGYLLLILTWWVFRNIWNL
ncbi:DUF2752 domain-containing protein [Parabacteroides distasonis]|uniref:DUF2752 domain-containing protein n=1 Tax=Parabacteroides distasonis TaxID=823 RepID=A0A4S2ETT5_PARDI|nr:DUF2752 domain-containing protein [Parabacteroides distasonis]